MRRAEGPMHPQQRRPVLRRSVGVRRDAERDRTESLAQREPGTQRPAVLPRALRVVGHRTKVPRDAREALERARRTIRGAVAWLAGSTKAGMSPGGGGRGGAAEGPGRGCRASASALAAGGAGRAAEGGRSEPVRSGRLIGSALQRPPPVPSARRFITDREGVVPP